MNSLQQEFNELQTGNWAEQNPSKCPCRGRGWLLSDLDTWHQCPVHGSGAPYPESEGDEDFQFDYAAHYRAVHVQAFKAFRDLAQRYGTGTNLEFNDKVSDVLKHWGITDPTMSDWVDAAETVATHLARFVADRQAVAAGFSCDLERRMDEDAHMEAMERSYGGSY